MHILPDDGDLRMAESAVAATESPGRFRWRLSLRQKEELSGWLWTAPWWGGFLLFSAYPMIYGFYMSLTNARWVGLGDFVGTQNYVTALTTDPLFWPSMARTLYYTGFVVPFGLAASLLAALILNQKLVGQNIFRTLFYIPSLMPSVALVVMWAWILNPKYGLLNHILASLSITGPGWLHSSAWAMPSLFLMAIWGSFGGSSMLIFLAALQSVPLSLYEACELDGGGSWHKFRHVTVPMISPAIFFNFVMGIINSFQSFLFSFLGPSVPGGPNYATYTLSLHMYKIGFEDGRLGYATALAWLQFVLVVAIILINYKFSGRWLFMAAMEND
jgi:multiple sugar transport system permease protein